MVQQTNRQVDRSLTRFLSNTPASSNSSLERRNRLTFLGRLPYRRIGRTCMSERKVYKDYDESDVRDVFDGANPVSWQDMVRFLEQRGLETWQVTPGEDAHMIADAKQAMKDNVPFSRSSEQSYRVLKSHRNPELVRQEEQRWIAEAEKKSGSGSIQRKKEA
jgi:hypothetical protein